MLSTRRPSVCLLLIATILLPCAYKAHATEFELGLWRIVARDDRATIGEIQDGQLGGADYAGTAEQHWRLKALAGSQYQLQHEKTQKCLALSGKAVQLESCGAGSTSWQLETLRERTEAQPALYRLKSKSGSQCLIPAGGASPTIGACDDKARLYIEPVGWGERSAPVQHEVHALLLVKPKTAAPNTSGELPADVVDAVQESFKTHVAAWLSKITDGQVSFQPTTKVAPAPITSFYVEGENHLPLPQNIPEDIDDIAPRGRFDTVQVFFTPGDSATGGWGWGPGGNHRSNYAYWTTVNGANTSAAKWRATATSSGIAEVFIHEPMHGYDRHYGRRGLPLPEGALHGTEENRYVESSNKDQPWLHWLRDYWLGTVIAADDTYRGYGPRMFRMPTPRQYASGPHKLVHKNSGKCVSTKNGSTKPDENTPAVLSNKCSDSASSFVLQSDGKLKHVGSGFCLAPEHGAAKRNTSLVFSSQCSAEPRYTFDLVKGPDPLPEFGSLKNLATGLCLHPASGTRKPKSGTALIFRNGCDEEHLIFEFLLES